MTSKAANRSGDDVLVIAEAGVNHNGSVETGIELIHAAKSAGADIVKFQTFRAKKLVTANAPRASYQDRNTGDDDSQLEMLQKLELSDAQHHKLLAACNDAGIGFLSTPFDEDSIAFLVDDLKVERLKTGSGDLTNGPLLLACARHRLPVLVSTGMASLGEVEEALSVLAFGFTAGPGETPDAASLAAAYNSDEGQRALKEKVLVFHCTTEYPAPFDATNLRAMDTLASAFGLPVGFSDHTPGITAAIAAVARGARCIEKHLTMDRNLPGPDHKASLEPDEFAEMVSAIRQTSAMLGSPVKAPTPVELPNMAVARKSLVAACDIAAGERYSEKNLAVMRPGGGIKPNAYWSFLGRKAGRDYRAGEMIEL
ncbi:MAG TPA: N-acetylneuraminate synthase [Rhizobiales bacterium]|nr:N-acetylneuraminate synthase [Hyphomicrobiales bacterium]